MVVSGRYRSEMLTRYWSQDNRGGYCRAPTCHQIPGTLEHLLATCPALDTVRQRLYTMWLENTVMFPTLHSIVRDILLADEFTITQFILEPLAFPQLADCHKIHGEGFIKQLSYLTRTFAFYLHREYSKIKKSPPTNQPITVRQVIDSSQT